MNTSLILRAALLGLVVIGTMAGWNAVKNANDGVKLIYFIFIGAGVGIWVIRVVLPRLGDALGTFVYSSVEEVEPDDRMKAAAKLAQGDFKGAIKVFEKLAMCDPEDPHPVAEIARIHSQFLHDPRSALAVLERALEAHAWSEQAAVFLRFRTADVLFEDLNDYGRARHVLEGVMTDFPNTGYSATARHRLYELEQSALGRGRSGEGIEGARVDAI